MTLYGRAPLALWAAVPSPLTAGECLSAATLHGLSSHLSPAVLYTCPLTSGWLPDAWYVFFLAGLAKPMGLVEGPGGLGQGGAAATLGGDSRDVEGKYEEYGYNAQLSDRISLDRSIPDYRPKKYDRLVSSHCPSRYSGVCSIHCIEMSHIIYSMAGPVKLQQTLTFPFLSCSFSFMLVSLWLSSWTGPEMVVKTLRGLFESELSSPATAILLAFSHPFYRSMSPWASLCAFYL